MARRPMTPARRKRRTIRMAIALPILLAVLVLVLDYPILTAGQALRAAQRYLRTATIADLTEAGWFDPRRLRRIGLVAEDMRRMSRLSTAHRPFASLRCCGGYILY